MTQQFIADLSQRPEIERAFTSFAINYPQWQVDIDAAQCKRAGISPTEILGVLSAYCGGQYISDFNRFSRVFKVMMQADPQARLDEESLNHMYVRVGDEMAPLDSSSS